MMNEKENMMKTVRREAMGVVAGRRNRMINETKVLEVVKMVTGGDVNAHFFSGTLFVETVDSKIASEIFCAITEVA